MANQTLIFVAPKAYTPTYINK